MRQALAPHPDTPCAAAIQVEAEAVRTAAGGLTLRYSVTGDVGALRLPEPIASVRADGLWRHTCFEAFVRASGPGGGYYEFNLSPSGEWAAYRFSGYRDGMANAGMGPPHIHERVDDGGHQLEVRLDVATLMDLPRTEPWRMGLAAVIEDTSGRKSYWALAHPPGKPDFHHSDGFALQLPAASPA